MFPKVPVGELSTSQPTCFPVCPQLDIISVHGEAEVSYLSWGSLGIVSVHGNVQCSPGCRVPSVPVGELPLSRLMRSAVFPTVTFPSAPQDRYHICSWLVDELSLWRPM